MPKVTIYVPNDLAEQMEEVETNWSGVAQRAFTRELLRIKAMSKTEDTVARLRASKAEAREEDEDQGKEEGAAWAKEIADYRELKRCARLYNDSRGNRFDVDLQVFAKSVLKLEDCSDIKDFVNSHIDENIDAEDVSDDYIAGFLEGAVDVWREVADKV